MKMTGWYRYSLGVWVLSFLPFHAFVMLFNNKSLLSLPDAPGPNGSPLVLYLVYMAVMLSPVLALPFALRPRS